MLGKLICLMRHSEAVAQLSETITRDFDKPLTDDGIHQLEHVRGFFKAQHFLPDLILCSPTIRTRQTLEWVQEALGTGAEVVVDEEIYGIKAEGLLHKLSLLPNKKSTVLIVGHNPAISEVMQTFWNLVKNKNAVSLDLPAKPAQLAIFRTQAASWESILSEEFMLEASYMPQSI
jgi:phosphohistidine phosphatase